MLVSLFKKDVTGAIRSWVIEGTVENNIAVIEIEQGIVGGAKQTYNETILQGLGGRSLKEQMMSRIASRVMKQRDRGYVNGIDKARDEAVTNQLNLKMPMLAQKYKGKLPDVFYLQHKYDGNRCLIHNDNGNLIAYTRAGKENPNLDHILSSVDIPVGATLDGELYHHGTPLQTIRSWVSRKQPNTEKLMYMVYDIMTDEAYSKRLERLKSLELGLTITLAETTYIDRFKLELKGGIKALLKSSRDLGYEGLIARSDDLGYEDGKRSKSLIKIKEWESEEYIVTDVIASKDNWGILVCMTDSGTFRVSAPGSIAEKCEILDNKQDYIGMRVTVEFANLTAKGIPFHPVAIAFRNNGE